MSSTPEPVPLGRALAQLLALAAWLGAALFFALVVAPAAFSALPSRDLAGALVGRTLPLLFLAGIAIGLIALGIELLGPRRRLRIGRAAASAIVAIACAVAQLGVAPRIAALRAGMTEPLASLAADHPQRVAFGRLHLISVAWLGVAVLACVAAMAMAVLALRAADADRLRGDRSPSPR